MLRGVKQHSFSYDLALQLIFDKPLPEPIMDQFSDKCTWHTGSYVA